MKLTISRVVRRFRKNSPACAQDALIDCAVPLRHLGSGCFRHGFQIEDLPLVAKFPHEEDDGDGINHSNAEIASLKYVLKSKACLELHQYMPRVYYHNRMTGTILMHKYLPVPKHRRKQADKLEKLVEKIMGQRSNKEDRDCHWGNMGVDTFGNLKIMDLGMFE